MEISIAIVTLAAAWILSLVLTPLVAKFAQRWGVLDHPDGHRKSQLAAVPTGGGMAVAISAAVTIVLVLMGGSLSGHLSVGAAFAEGSILVVGLLPAALVLITIGLIDDLFGITGIYKVFGQVFAVSLLVSGGFQFDCISLFWMDFPLGNLSIPFTMFFCLGAINAFNLIDGIDGLASSVGTLAFLTLGIITASQGNVIPMLLCFAFSGALLGFLRYNLPPAKIYLGDTGSMLIGLVVAALAIHCSLKEQAAFVLFVPLAICAIPILDAGAALVRRVTTGQSVFTPDRGHLHHSLLLLGWSVGNTVTFIAALAAITCGGALASYFTHQEAYALAATAGVCIALAAFGIFGHTELKLLFSHTRAMIGAVLHRIHQRERVSEKSIQLQGTRHWKTIWEALLEAVPVYQLSGVRLRINIPHLHESFYGDWQRKDGSFKTPAAQGLVAQGPDVKTDRPNASAPTHGHPAVSEAWKVHLPLLHDGSPIGTLMLLGPDSGSQSLTEIQQVLDFLEPLESEIQRVISQVASSADSAVPSTAVPYTAVLSTARSLGAENPRFGESRPRQVQVNGEDRKRELEADVGP